MKNVIPFPSSSGRLARPTDPSTSHDAIPDNVDELWLRTLQVFEDGKALMAWQVEALGIPGVGHQRVSDLGEKKMGCIAPTGEKGPTPAGKTAEYHRITEVGLDWLDYMSGRKERRKAKVMRKKDELRGYQDRVIKHLYEHDEAMAVLKMGAGKTI